jgi:3-dehydroquinate dehydratase type I
MAGCDLVEIRLDVLARDGWEPGQMEWSHLGQVPLLFTARCSSEGGALALSAPDRAAMIRSVIDDATAVDVEIAAAEEMTDTLSLLRQRGIPWVASRHNFEKLPDLTDWREWRDRAHTLGAAVAKFAAMLHQPSDIDLLEDFQREKSAIAVATMGMGALAPASRVRCAMAGSCLNYGYLGAAPTAPGQWPAAELRAAIRAGNIPHL